jgi:two-component system cell cycle sensor histidine kinase/response regulator CckA
MPTLAGMNTPLDSTAALQDALDAQTARVQELTRELEQHRALLAAEQERRKLELRVAQLKKLDSLGVLAGGIAHDFNNLLTSILGNTDLALAHLPPGSPVRAHLRHIEYAAQRAADLAWQMLAYSGRGQFLIRPVSVGKILRAKLPTIRATLPERIRLDCELADPLPAIDGDDDLLGQLLVHVIGNAIDAVASLGRDGVIQIRTDACYCTRADLASTYVDDQLPEGHYVCVDIADTGCGMSAETQERMFEPFFSTKFTGRGLGLAAALGILRGHRGAVRVISEIGKGTTMRMFFPASTSRQVLVIDDEETVRSVAKTILERVGYKVITAPSAAEGLQQFRDAGGDFCVVLLDMRLPMVDGRPVFDGLLAVRPDARIVLSSGFLKEEALATFSDSRVAGYLQKPYRFDDLVDCVRNVVGPEPEKQRSAGSGR